MVASMWISWDQLDIYTSELFVEEAGSGGRLDLLLELLQRDRRHYALRRRRLTTGAIASALPAPRMMVI